MHDKHLLKSDALYHYIASFASNEDELLRDLREQTAALPEAEMQISADQGAFMKMLAGIMGVTNAIEIGTFTGYSAISVARALTPNGHLLCCDVNKKWTDIAQSYWERAGLNERISLHLKPAVETLDQLITEGRAGQFDFAFVDADKSGYDAYYERLLILLRPGGVMLLDNAVRGGRVLDPPADDFDTRAIIKLNQKVHEDDRVQSVMLPIADGIMLVHKR